MINKIHEHAKQLQKMVKEHIAMIKKHPDIQSEMHNEVKELPKKPTLTQGLHRPLGDVEASEHEPAKKKMSFKGLVK